MDAIKAMDDTNHSHYAGTPYHRSRDETYGGAIIDSQIQEARVAEQGCLVGRARAFKGGENDETRHVDNYAQHSPSSAGGAAGGTRSRRLMRQKSKEFGSHDKVRERGKERERGRKRENRDFIAFTL